MSNDNFNPLELLQNKFRYPFPALKNPHAYFSQKITENQWIEGGYFFLYEYNRQIRKKYKKTNNAYIAAQWFPTGMTQ